MSDQTRTAIVTTAMPAEDVALIADLVGLDVQKVAAIIQLAERHLFERLDRTPPRHRGFRWVRFGRPRRGEWYDDGGTFEEADDSWTVPNGEQDDHKVHVYAPDSGS